MKMVFTFTSRKEDCFAFWKGEHTQQSCSPLTTWSDREAFLRELGDLLMRFGSVSSAAWGDADFHFNPDPDRTKPCFISVIFRNWPEGILSKIMLMVEDYHSRTGHWFYFNIDGGGFVVTTLAKNQAMVFYDEDMIGEASLRKMLCIPMP